MPTQSQNIPSAREVYRDIMILESRISSHYKERDALKAVLDAVEPAGDNPNDSMAAGQRRKLLTEQISAMESAIAAFEAKLDPLYDLQRTRQQEAEYQSNLNAVKQADRDFHKARQRLDELRLEIMQVLTDVKQTWQNASPAYQKLQSHNAPPTQLLDGDGVFGLPTLEKRERDRGWTLRREPFNLLEEERREHQARYRPRRAHGGSDRTTNARPITESRKTFSHKELSNLSPSEAALRIQGFSGPDARAIADGRKLPSQVKRQQ